MSDERKRNDRAETQLQSVNVSVADEFLDQFDQVVRRCARIGLRVTQELKEIGVISGRIAGDKLDDLARVRGVAAVEATREIQLPPPESDVQ
jgi:hypothetical protein